MEINIYEDGQVIHLETCSNDCNVATVCNGNVIENVESFNDLDLFSVKIGTGVIACKAEIIPETTERESDIAINAILAIRVYKKLEAENKVHSEDSVDIAQLTRDCADIAIEYVDTYGEEYGWTDFIESKLLELYGIK